MPQLHLYVPEEIAAKVKEKAKSQNMTVSGYLSNVIKRELGEGWPEDYFKKVSGQWKGEFPEIIREEPEDLRESF